MNILDVTETPELELHIRNFLFEMNNWSVSKNYSGLEI